MNVADDGHCIRTATACQMSYMLRMEAKTWDVKSTARVWQSPASDYYRGDDQKRRDERPKSGLQQAGNRHPQNGPERVESLQPADALAPLAFWCELDDEQACYGVRGSSAKTNQECGDQPGTESVHNWEAEKAGCNQHEAAEEDGAIGQRPIRGPAPNGREQSTNIQRSDGYAKLSGATAGIGHHKRNEYRRETRCERTKDGIGQVPGLDP